jgi:predicted nucleotidyltransferase
MPDVIFADRAALGSLCSRYHIRRLSLFGSALRGCGEADSDVDLLVEFEPGQEPGLLGLAGIEADLAALLADGRRVDLRTARDLSRHFRADVIEQAAVQYTA